MIFIIDNILTPYEIARYNRINKEVNNTLTVWFHSVTETNRNWKRFPKIDFEYHISKKGSNQMDLVRFLFENKSNISRIICCGWNHPMYWYCLLFSSICFIRFTVWSGSTAYERSFFRYLSQPLVRVFISLCNDFIAYGTRAKKYLESLGAKSKDIEVYINSVDVDFFHTKSFALRKNRKILRKKYHIPISHTVILFVGQLIERKGIQDLIEAYLSISRQHDKVTLLLVGSGYLKDYVHKVITDNPNYSIVHVDHSEYDQIPQIYAVSDVLVLPSKTEVWGLVVNEAMASGIPVIVSRNAGCSADLVKNGINGFVIFPNQKNIEKALSQFLSLSLMERNKLGREAKETIRGIYEHTYFSK